MANTDDDQIFFEEFSDHAGEPAVRYGARPAVYEEDDDESDNSSDSTTADDSWPPVDYESESYFCFQVYITFDLALNEQICKAITAHLIDLEDAQCEPPIWEFYVAPRTPLDCVDHSRREIAHRRTCSASPLIDPLCLAEYDDRKLGFAFILDCENGWRTSIKGTQFVPVRFPDNTGPLWAHFDPRIPSSVIDIDDIWLMDSDQEEERLDQLEMQVRRIQGKDADAQILCMYNHSVSPITNEYHNDGDHVDSPPTDTINLLQLASDWTVTKHESSITIAHFSGEPQLHYVVCMAFAGDLEHTARVFAASVARLTDKSFCFDFYSATSDTAALASCPVTSVGVLTQTFAKRAHWDPIGTERSAPGLRRLHPLDYRPRMYYQDPATSKNPFRICLIMLDRPDFTRVPAVRFLLAGGWPQHYEENNYLEILSWRSSSMQAVVDRMMLQYKDPNDAVDARDDRDAHETKESY